MRNLRVVACVAFLLACSTASFADTIHLPELGDTASVYLSAEQEKELRQQFMGWVYQRMEVIEDPEVSEYINSLGYKLVAHSEKNTQPFYFFVVNDDSINAFAGPGGVIGIHSGLIQATSSASELAAVLAHEVAHVTQRHLARAYEAASRSSLPATAAVLAAIILGTKNPEAGQAALTTAIASNIQGQINFTRDNEQEADAIGIQLLADAGFQPRGMTDFFLKLKKKTELSDSDLPALLRTHPLTLSRIAQAKSRIKHLGTVTESQRDDLSYALFREQVISLQASEGSHIYNNRMDEKTDHKAIYKEVLVLIAQGEAKKSMHGISILLKRDPRNVSYQIVHIKAQQELGAYAYTSKLLDLYTTENPESRVLKYYQAQSLVFSGNPSEAAVILKKLVRTSPLLYFYPLLARAEEARGNPMASHEILADYFIKKGLLEKAIEQLSVALKQTGQTKDKNRLEKRLKSLQKQANTER